MLANVAPPPPSSWVCPSPFVIAALGPNGAGKSTIERTIGIGDRTLMDRVRNGRAFIDEETGQLGILTVNADAIARSLLKANPTVSTDNANREAQRFAEQQRWYLASKRADFAFESVGSHPSKLEFLQELKEAGYYVAVLLVSTEDPTINVRRVAERVQNNGHDVPTDKIIKRYHRMSELIPGFYEVADYFVAYDNSRDTRSANEESARLLLVKDDQGLHLTEHCSEVKWIHEHLLDKI